MISWRGFSDRLRNNNRDFFRNELCQLYDKILLLDAADSLGNVQWERTYSAGDLNSGECIILTDDGGFAIAGNMQNYGGFMNGLLFVKADYNGNVEWIKTYAAGGVGKSSIINRIN